MNTAPPTATTTHAPWYRMLYVQVLMAVALKVLVQPALELVLVQMVLELVLVRPLAQQLVLQVAVQAQVWVLKVLLVQVVHLFRQMLVVAFSP